MRDEQHCPPGHLYRYRSDSLGVGLNLLGQAVQHPLRDRQFVPLDLDLLKLLGQLLGEGIQFAPGAVIHCRSCIPAPPALLWRADLPTDRRRKQIAGAAEPDIPPERDPPDDLHQSHRPPTGVSTPLLIHTRPATCDFTMHTAH
ncbi:hypothetical protein ACWC2H_37420 [Streptomyces sp. 900105755]